uniref:Uncharacterized protein n=1 Tax=Pristionchus pacificus TaxID=54126 RepID=A0A2A6CD39_PRIPA|eukprot:PDM76036.1 hypothetical protein PRIPAC_39640 [Pristionchus pacificus]
MTNSLTWGGASEQSSRGSVICNRRLALLIVDLHRRYVQLRRASRRACNDQEVCHKVQIHGQHVQKQHVLIHCTYRKGVQESDVEVGPLHVHCVPHRLVDEVFRVDVKGVREGVHYKEWPGRRLTFVDKLLFAIEFAAEVAELFLELLDVSSVDNPRLLLFSNLPSNHAPFLEHLREADGAANMNLHCSPPSSLSINRDDNSTLASESLPVAQPRLSSWEDETRPLGKYILIVNEHFRPAKQSITIRHLHPATHQNRVHAGRLDQRVHRERGRGRRLAVDQRHVLHAARRP